MKVEVETGRIAGHPVPHSVGPRRPGDSPRLVGDISFAQVTGKHAAGVAGVMLVAAAYAWRRWQSSLRST